MPNFEVEYSYDVPEYGTTTVNADTIDDAEYIALKQISESLEVDVGNVYIETIKEKKNND